MIAAFRGFVYIAASKLMLSPVNTTSFGCVTHGKPPEIWAKVRFLWPRNLAIYKKQEDIIDPQTLEDEGQSKAAYHVPYLHFLCDRASLRLPICAFVGARRLAWGFLYATQPGNRPG